MRQELPSDIFLIAAAGVGVLSAAVRRHRDERSSWPTWLLVPLVMAFVIVLGVETLPPPPAELRVFYFTVIALILLRWVIALVRCERGRGWLFYLILLVAVPCVIEAGSALVFRR